MVRWALALVLATGVAVRADDKAPGARQQAKSFEKEITVKVKLNYLLYLPDGYGKGDKAWPLVLFLHGAGESGNNLAQVKRHGPPKLIEGGKDFPFIVVSPQSPGRGWDARMLGALLDDVMATHKVDKDRVYVTGLSMGGFGTWSLAAAYPDRFAAIVPICGGGSPGDASKIKEVPAWVFHGAKDRVVVPARSETMVKALKDAGAREVKYTLYPNAEHDSWTETYNNPEVWEWLLKHKRNEK
jgi:predicted peptidase